MIDAEAMRQAYVVARAAWPGISVTQEAFEARVADSFARRQSRALFAQKRIKTPGLSVIETSDL